MTRSLAHRPWRALLLRWLPLLLWMAWVYWISDQPSVPHPGRRVGVSDNLFDYSAHAFTFGVLTVLVWRVLSTWRLSSAPLSPWRPGVAGALAALYAVSDEVHQSFVPGRWAKVQDWLADLLGILVAVGLLYAWRRQRPRVIALLPRWLWGREGARERSSR